MAIADALTILTQCFTSGACHRVGVVPLKSDMAPAAVCFAELR